MPPQRGPDGRVRLTCVLLVDGISKRYGDVVALDEVSFEVPAGKVVGFLGPNGAGKTTAMRAIMRLIALDAGEVVWNDVSVTPRLRQRFGYMPAERGMYQRMKVRDHLLYYGRLSGLSSARAASAADVWLERLGLTDRADATVQALSSGNQQRVQLALALLNDPELLVLDEPFSGLDPVATQVLAEVLREQVDQGTALLLSSHQLDLVAEVCSAVVIVDHGQVVLRGDVAELRAASEVRYVDVEFATTTTWPPGGPVDRMAIDGDGRRHRISVGTSIDAQRIVEDAHRVGEVISYSFAPPDLSEVFMRAVGRDTVEVSSALTPDGTDRTTGASHARSRR